MRRMENLTQEEIVVVVVVAAVVVVVVIVTVWLIKKVKKKFPDIFNFFVVKNESCMYKMEIEWHEILRFKKRGEKR